MPAKADGGGMRHDKTKAVWGEKAKEGGEITWGFGNFLPRALL